MKMKSSFLAGMVAVACAGQAHAAVSTTQAAQLGTTLTKWGAIQAGSADGAIPAYTGGFAAMSNLPANAGPTQGWPNPFLSEKPLFTINSTNMSQYAAELTPGAQAMLQRYPDYHILVYPTHRTMSYPAWVQADTVKNATTAQEVGDGDGVADAYGGIPFPIPQDGNQAIWNTFLQYRPAYCEIAFNGFLIDANGGVTVLSDLTKTTFAEPYYDPTQTSLAGPYYRWVHAQTTGPAQYSGNQFLFAYNIDYTKNDQLTWFYSPGTRRVRLAPEDKYDTPISSYGGNINFDELNLFAGQLDKFDFKLVGEKEMIIPYNDYDILGAPQNQLIGKHFMNPNLLRWERHRVWVVDATLKPGQRHVYSRWTFYIDEDTWEISMSESYDHAGQIYKVGMDTPSMNYTQGDAISIDPAWVFYDLSKGDWDTAYGNTGPGNTGYWNCSTAMPNLSRFTSQAMAASGVH